MPKLNGKIALITGGTTGIGAATAKLFQAEGATVIVTGSNPKTLEAARAKLSGIEVIASDQADTTASKSLADHIKSKHGRIDVLFVNAGNPGMLRPLEAIDEEYYDKIFNINVRGAFFTIKHAAPIIPDGGAIVLTSSVSGSTGGAGMTVYAATKAAVRSLGRSLAAELAPRNIRVNVVSPGYIDTPITAKLLAPDQIDDATAVAISKTALKRAGRPEEVAAAVLHLAEDATFVTAAELMVDGGLRDI